MAKVEASPDARAPAGIGISTSRHEVTIPAPRRPTLLDIAANCPRPADAVPGFDLPVRIGFAATAGYHRALTRALGSAGFELNLASFCARGPAS